MSALDLYTVVNTSYSLAKYDAGYMALAILCYILMEGVISADMGQDHITRP